MALIDSVQAYCTRAEADAILGVTSPWVGATGEDKDAALKQGALYIDFNYACTFDEIPDNLKEANAILANEHLTQSLWDRQDGLAPMSEKSVKAGSVASTTKYAEHGGSRWVDPFPNVTALLSYGGVCELTQGGIAVQGLVRR